MAQHVISISLVANRYCENINLLHVTIESTLQPFSIVCPPLGEDGFGLEHLPSYSLGVLFLICDWYVVVSQSCQHLVHIKVLSLIIAAFAHFVRHEAL